MGDGSQFVGSMEVSFTEYLAHTYFPHSNWSANWFGVLCVMGSENSNNNSNVKPRSSPQQESLGIEFNGKNWMRDKMLSEDIILILSLLFVGKRERRENYSRFQHTALSRSLSTLWFHFPILLFWPQKFKKEFFILLCDVMEGEGFSLSLHMHS